MTELTYDEFLKIPRLNTLDDLMNLIDGMQRVLFDYGDIYVISSEMWKSLQSKDISLYDVFYKWIKGFNRSKSAFTEWFLEVYPNCSDREHEDLLQFLEENDLNEHHEFDSLSGRTKNYGRQIGDTYYYFATKNDRSWMDYLQTKK